MNIQKPKQYISSHKFLSVCILLILILGSYGIYKWKNSGTTETSYVIAAVQKGTVISSITGSGQVSASNEIDLQSKASGQIASVNAVVGQKIKAGQLIAKVDSRDTEIGLENAKIAMEKLVEPSDPADIQQAKNSLAKAYDSGFNSVASTFLDFPETIEGLDNLINTSDGYLSSRRNTGLNNTAKADRDLAEKDYYASKDLYKTNTVAYQGVTRNSSPATIEQLIQTTYDTVKSLTETLKDSKNSVEYISQRQDKKNETEVSQVRDNLVSWTNTMNSHLSDLSSAKNSIEDSKKTLANLEKGPDALDVKEQQLSLEQKQTAYDDLFIRAPFDGVLAKLTIQKSDSVSNGTSIGTFITEQKVADITVNEVDAAKIKTGQKATLTFDAIEGLSISGTVAEIDLIGTASQGVVSYNVKIAFDTQDDRIKSGMSVSANVITNSEQDVLVVPNNAIKISGDTSYVETVDKSIAVTNNQGTTLSIEPTQATVETGLSDDTYTQILSGLSEGDKIITKTVTSSSATTKTSSNLLGNLFGRNRNSSSSGSTNRTSGTSNTSKTTTSTQTTPPNGGGMPPL